ncbi:unnamed protein product [Calicophoron daubneyi]|uniref:Ras-GAP domain-containing protein n=1 Tax=Calicophoron daubneyi TaxID=300641 RepID=A0AAV2TPR5_CALDB
MCANPGNYSHSCDAVDEKNASTSSLVEFGGWNDSIDGSLFQFRSSAFTLPHALRSLLVGVHDGSRSLPSAKSLGPGKYRAHFGTHKTLSSVSLNSLPDENFNDIWAGSLILRRTAKPNLENELHRENSLRLSILEARNLSSKRRYYCDICLDRTLYARTTTKIAAPGIFWAEDFDLNNLPNVSVMTISLYKEGDSLGKEGRRFGTSRISMKKHKKPQNQLVGYLTIPMLEISGRNDTQVWLNLQTPTDVSARDGIFVSNSHDDGDISSDGTVRSQISSHLPVVGSETAGSSVLSSKQSRAANGDQNNSPQLRIRARYLSIEVLPLRNYLPLKTLILDQSIPLSKWLENLLPVKSKEEIANSLVALHECNGTVVKFLTDLVVNEVSTLENESMAFRSNTMATKAVECYVKLAGSTYLHNLLYRIIQKILTCLRAWEVDPEKLPSSSSTAQSLTVADTAAFGRPASSAALTLPQKSPPGSLLSNQLMLLHHFHLVWRAIQTSIPQFPSVLMKVFSSFRSALEPSRGAEFCDYLISGCIFLRLICPAVLSPSLFGLVSAFPSDPWCQRNLTLLAKSLQSLANFTTFDDKEPYMRFLNGYVSTQLPVMRHFIRTISTWSTVSGRPDDQDTAGGLRDLVDEGYELANLHLLLSDLLRTRSLDQKRNQEVTIKNTSSESSLIASPDLPKAFFQLPRLLNDLSFIRQAISNRSRSTHTGRHSRSKTQWLAKVTTTDQGMGPMTCSTASDFSIPPTTGCSLKSIPAAENVYQSHNPSSLIPYYTLHQNPGVVAPNTNGKQKTAVNILSPELRYAAPIANPSHNQSSVPVCGGKSRCLFSLPSVHDYDEPYYSRHSDSDPEDHRSEMVEGTQRACSAEPAYPDINLIGNGTSRRMTLPIPSAGASPSIIHRLSRGRTRNPIGTHDEDHIYDAVPLSDESSTDELADASEPEGSKSREVNHSQSNGYSPHEHVKNPHKPAVGGDAFTPTSETLLSYPSKSPRPTRLALGSRAEPGLSPRLLTKQIATASVLLSKSSVPDRSAEQAAITVQSNSSSGLLGPDDSNSQTLLTSPHSPTHSVQTTSVFLPLSQKHRLPKITTSRDSDKSPDRVNGSMGKNQANAMCSKENEESLLGVKQANGSSASSTGLEQEVVRLRQQLQISRADAARAANRLSQQEAELAQLRHLLAQVQAQPTILQLSQTSTASRLSQVSPAVPKPWTPSASVSTASVLEPQKQGSKNNAATFDELDDAMARLEHEQNELLREQSRIRARLAVTRLQNSVAPYSPAYSSSSSQSNGNEHQTLQSASQSLQLPSSAPIRGASKSYQNLFASGPPPILSQYGPKIRHAPPPQRYAQNPHNRRPP